MITLVLGGARSGKSAVAEALAARSPGPVTYIATTVGDPADEDLQARIARHRARRPPAWATCEVAPAQLSAVLGATAGTVLVDSLGGWVAAAMDFAVEVQDVAAALAGRDGDSVIVSEEVGMGVHPSSEVGRRFRDVLGEVNQVIAVVADEVLLIVAGRVLALRDVSSR